MDKLDQRTVTTRKEHSCWGCARTFPKGSRLEIVKVIDEGQFLATYWCRVCQDYWAKFMSSYDEIDIGELKHNDPDEWEKIR